MEAQDKIAKILRVDKRVIYDLEMALNHATGKSGILEKIVARNDKLMKDRMAALGLVAGARASEVYDTLISKIEADDLKICEAIGSCSARGYEAAQNICDFVGKLIKPKKGYFIKLEKAKEFLLAEPPKKILKAMGYATVHEMLQKEELLEVYSALRFLEDQEWLNDVFFKQYEKLQPEDFETREIQVRPLGEKWAAAAEKFVAKKYHNVSHLKELGVIFIIPIFLGMSGETLRLLSLLLHYHHEIEYYSKLFKDFMDPVRSSPPQGPLGAQSAGATSNGVDVDGKDFAHKVISLLRGDVAEEKVKFVDLEDSKARWLIVQRYLAKGDENDWRLFVPHINPEALHWARAEEDIFRIEKILPDLKDGLDFWRGLGWVGDFFQTEAGVPILVSFNLVDTVMALVKEKELIKYLYHQQEAMWNEIFASYYGEEAIEIYSRKHIIKGWFEV
jgi:hypothetical protein